MGICTNQRQAYPINDFQIAAEAIQLELTRLKGLND
jgi:hypothetical protein